MKTLVALSAIGEDQPGIVAALTKVFFETGCNMENSSMSQLRGDFAVLLIVSIPEGLTLGTLGQKLQPIIEKWNLTVNLRELEPGEIAKSVSATLPYTLKVSGLDHPGIVYRVAQTATEQKINITDLRTHISKNNNAPLYSLVLEIEIPSESALKSFENTLHSLQQELQVEMILKPAERKP